MLTLKELHDKIIEQFTELDLIELLKITTEDLVIAFEDKIEAKYREILDELDVGYTTEEDEEEY